MRYRNALGVRAVAAVCAGLLALCMVVFLALAGYFALREVVDPVYAALMTAGGCLLAAMAILLAAWLITARRREHRAGMHPTEMLEDFLEDGVDPVMVAWIRRHPDAAAAVTLALGIAAGYSSSVRRILQDLYVHYADSEAERRSSRRQRRTP